MYLMFSEPVNISRRYRAKHVYTYIPFLKSHESWSTAMHGQTPYGKHHLVSKLVHENQQS
jgi:hypothetical protein